MPDGGEPVGGFGPQPSARSAPAPTETSVDLAGRLPAGTLVAGRYRVVAPIGIGGMGIVYRAHDEELDAPVALKILRPDLGRDAQWLERFRRELVLGRQVSHRNVVRIHDIGESGGLRFLTMGYVEGRSLQDVVDKDGPLPPDRAVAVVRQLAEALQAAHDAGVVHRDLKPANVLLSDDGTAYITDFGVARSLQRERVTREGAVVGTPDYLSPEQVRGEAVDGRSDIYALGILFFEMLTGELPFSASSHAELVAQRIAGRPRDISETSVAAPPHIGAIIRRCLERNPARRYQQARDIIPDLDRGGTGWWGRVGARGRWIAAAALVIALAAVWILARRGAGGSVLPWIRPERAEAPAPATTVARHGVAVLPFSDQTGDPALAWTGVGVAEMLTANMSENRDLRVVDALRVMRTLRDLQVAPGAYDAPLIRQIAQLLAVDTVLAGTVREAGGQLRIDVRVMRAAAGGELATRDIGSQQVARDRVFQLVDDLAARVRRDLGVAAPASLAESTPDTTSVEAAQAYTEGRNYLVLGDYVQAAPAFERAVERDPQFAPAIERLSETYQNLGFEDKAIAAAERAVRAAGEGRTRVAYRARARLALLRGEPQEAENRYAELAREYPNDTELLLDLAAAQGAQGNSSAAVDTLKRVVALDQTEARAWFLLGKNTILMGDSGRAVNDYLVRALTLQNRLRNEPGQAEVLNALGVAHHQLGEYAQAVEKYRASAAIRRRIGDERGLATNLKNLARTHMAMSRFADAETDLRAAREVYERIGDRSGLADVLNDVGVLFEGRGDYAQARGAYEAALKIRRSLGDDRLLAQSYDNVGYVYYLEGQYDSALVYWKEALALRKKIGEKGGIILSTQNLGFLQLSQGRWDEALQSFVGTLDQSRAIDFKNAVAVSLGNLGLLYRYQGRYGAAMSSFAEALKVLDELEDARGLTEFTLREADTLLELGRRDEAKARLDAAAKWLGSTGNREQAADHHALLAQWHVLSGSTQAARDAFGQAGERARASRSRTAILRARVAEGVGRAELGDAANAITLLAPALREAESIGDAMLQIRSAEALALAYLTRGRPAEAETAARRALDLADRSGWNAGLYRLHGLVGRILETRGRASDSDRHYRDSAARLERLRENLPREWRDGFDASPRVRQVRQWLSHRESGKLPTVS